MKDFNALFSRMGQGEENPDFCRERVPTIEQVLASAKAEWRSNVQRVADESKGFKVAAPDVRLLTPDEARKASCATVSVQQLCLGK